MAPTADTKTNVFDTRLIRSIMGLPFLLIFAWCAYAMQVEAMGQLLPELEQIGSFGKIEFESITVPILDNFHHIKILDDTWKLGSVMFASSTMGMDPVSWHQMFSFLIDLGVLYSIWLFESCRKVDRYSPARFPVIFGVPVQLAGIGVVAPLYYFLHLLSGPPANVTNLGTQSMSRAYSRTIWFTMSVFSYVPVCLMYLLPSPSAQHFWTWAWQLFPVYTAVAGTAFGNFPFGETQKSTTPSSRDRDRKWIVQATIGGFGIISAATWILTVLRSPYSLSEIFFPWTPTEQSYLLVLRWGLQCDHIAAFGSSLLWLLYLFADLKRGGMTDQSWLFILASGVATTFCFGPGASLAAGYLWRESMLI